MKGRGTPVKAVPDHAPTFTTAWRVTSMPSGDQVLPHEVRAARRELPTGEREDREEHKHEARSNSRTPRQDAEDHIGVRLGKILELLNALPGPTPTQPPLPRATKDCQSW